MNKNKTLLIIALAFVLLLGGAYFLYGRLSQGAAPEQLTVLSGPNTSPSDSVPLTEPGSTDPESAPAVSESPAEPNPAPDDSELPVNPESPVEPDSAPVDSDPLGVSEPDDSAPPAEEPESPPQETAEAEEPDEENTEPENPLAPDFTVYDLGGNAVRLSDFIGKPVVLNFWASWCGPCQSEMPDYNDAYLELGEEIHFLMVNMTDGSRETVEKASSFIEEQGYSFPVFYDTDLDAAMTYGVYSLPTTLFIDADGYGIAQATGAINRETLQRGIDMILPK